ncbi:MAG TPA: 6-carboxytetrahydropterin synthase [Fimbriimonas sp.]
MSSERSEVEERPVGLTRRVSFSSGHRYWLEGLTEAENRSLFGAWASPFSHGHNYVLDVSVSGWTDMANGMVVNIKWIDDVLQEKIVRRFDQRSLNDEVDYFRMHSPSLENLLRFIQAELTSSLPEGARLDRLKLEETPLLWGELDIDTGMVTVTRVYEFAASHRLHSSKLTHEENLELYGKCNNPAGHGHNYVLEVTVSGEPDERTGFLCDLGELDRQVNDRVVDRYDHRNLNEDLPEFKGVPTTSEILVLEVFRRLDGQLPAKLQRVRLWETARSSFEVSA